MAAPARLTGPLLPRVGVVAVVPDSWDSIWQTRHHVVGRLAQYVNLVWVEAPSLERRFRSAWSWANGEGAAPFQVYQAALWVHDVGRFAALGRRIRARQVRHTRSALRRLGCARIVMYLWRPEFAYALEGASGDATCYHIDDEHTFSPTDVPLGDSERALLRRVSQVFIHSPALLEKKGHVNPHTEWVPNGVDFAKFATPHPEPAALASIPRPRLGHAGTLKRHLDFSLLIDLARRHPHWSFVVVGPRDPHPQVSARLAELSQLPNVYFLDAQPSDELPAYVEHFDVCLMPYVDNDYTRYIYPLKLHEYLASGRPAVGTSIRSLQNFADVVLLARTREDWSAAITETVEVEARSSEGRAARQAVARRHDWDVIVERVVHALARRLGPDVERDLEIGLARARRNETR